MPTQLMMQFPEREPGEEICEITSIEYLGLVICESQGFNLPNKFLAYLGDSTYEITYPSPGKKVIRYDGKDCEIATMMHPQNKDLTVWNFKEQ